MADRLRILGAGNGMPILPNTGTGGEDYPLVATKAQIIELYWRVKKWQLNTDFEVTAGAESAILDSTLTYDFGPTRERDLILAPQASGHGFTFTLSSGAATGLGGFTIFNADPDLYRQPNATDYLPFLQISGALTAVDGADNAILNFDSRPSSIAETGSITANVNGIPLTLYYQDLFSGAGSSTHTTFNLTPIEWWPYAAKDASPIYNTATGAQLQSPLN